MKPATSLYISAPETHGGPYDSYTGMILGLRPASERRRHKVTASFIGWAQT